MTYLYRVVNEYYAVEAFREFERLKTDSTVCNFTPDAVVALFEYYSELAEDTGEPIEFDVIGWCCDWAQYEDIAEAAREHDNDLAVSCFLDERSSLPAGDLLDQNDDDLFEWFRDQTTVIEGDDFVLIQNF